MENKEVKEKSFTLICNNCGRKVVLREGFQGYKIDDIMGVYYCQDVEIVCDCGNGIDG